MAYAPLDLDQQIFSGLAGRMRGSHGYPKLGLVAQAMRARGLAQSEGARQPRLVAGGWRQRYSAAAAGELPYRPHAVAAALLCRDEQEAARRDVVRARCALA